jgi:Type II secretion system (T2SS), protein F
VTRPGMPPPLLLLAVLLLVVAALLAAVAAVPPAPGRRGRPGPGPATWRRPRLPAPGRRLRPPARGRRPRPGSGPATRRRLAEARRPGGPRAALERPTASAAIPPATGRHRAGNRRFGGPRAALERLAGRLPVPGRAATRRQELEGAVPEVLDVLRATISAGVAPSRALQAAAEGAPPPLAGTLGEAVRLARVGSGAGRALATAAGASGLAELLVAGEALDLAETTGAPPGPVLAGVAAAAADRVRARQARMAATAQARLSARVVAAMAPAFLGVLAVTSPSDAAFLVRDRLGWATLAAAAAFEATGIYWSGRIVRPPAP